MKALLLTLSAVAVAGCSNLYTASEYNADPSLATALYATETQYTPRRVAPPNAFQPAKFTVQSEPQVSSPNKNVVTIQHYVRGLMQEMVVSMQNVTEQTSVAVASFVYLDSDFNEASLISNQIAESFIHELHNFGVTVLDFKLTDFIRVTPQGDFVYSRDYEELNSNMNANYALGGTLSRHKSGILINARLVDFNSKAVVASAQSLVPNHIVNAILPSQATNRMSLVKDEK